MAFKPVYILILGVTIIVDYAAGRWLETTQDQKKRKALLILSIIANVGFLAFFKYFDFGAESAEKITDWMGVAKAFPRMNDMISNYVMPIGLSFHTFQAMSYTIEVYRKKQPAEKDFLIYALYVLFFPQLVAGPIERPQNVIWQFKEHFKWDWPMAKSGIQLMLWGFFKKCVISDRLAAYVDFVYDNPTDKSGTTILIAACLYSFQIYCDFSGYSDIAIGSARVMGFKLMQNFDRPYSARSITEFWRRWHISLSTWFRDYVYIPLGGSKGSAMATYRNTMVVFTLSGLWHGAKWTFVFWGFLHGFLLVFERIKNRYLAKRSFSETNFSKMLNTCITFLIISITWMFFRAKSFTLLKQLFINLEQISWTDQIQYIHAKTELFYMILLCILLFIKEQIFFEIAPLKNKLFMLYCFVFCFLIYFLGIFDQNQFIYFQF